MGWRCRPYADVVTRWPSVWPDTPATVPSPFARTRKLTAKERMGCSGENDSGAGDPPDTRMNPGSVERTGVGFPAANASNKVGTKAWAISVCPAEFGCRGSATKPSAHRPPPSSIAPSRLTLGTSHELMSRFIRRVYAYSRSVKSLRAYANVTIGTIPSARVRSTRFQRPVANYS